MGENNTADPTHDDRTVMNGAPSFVGGPSAPPEFVAGPWSDPTHDGEAVMNGAPSFVGGPPAARICGGAMVGPHP